MDDKKDNKIERFRTKIYVLMLEMVAIFGVPAAVAVIAGKALDRTYATNRAFTLTFLGIALVASWIAVAVKYRAMSRELKRLKER